jgi:hypothetical protein
VRPQRRLLHKVDIITEKHCICQFIIFTSSCIALIRLKQKDVTIWFVI